MICLNHLLEHVQIYLLMIHL